MISSKYYIIKGSVIMNKFETVSINILKTANTKSKALELFSMVCGLCPISDAKTGCDKCPIRIYHELTVAVFEDNESLEIIAI